ncbi:PAS domain S-box protein [Lyngbya aestuarii]|uniref:PAS domain S-box protein n=1 Tax=Lyngbya aestuarii TaxID=118322 RepID=UPI00403DB41D
MLEKFSLLLDGLSVTFFLTLTLLVATVGVGKRRHQQTTDTWQVDSQAKWQSLMQMTDGVLICLSLSYHILEWNPVAEKVYGWRQKEVIEQEYLAFLPEKVRDIFAAYCQLALTEQAALEFEHPVFSRDGQEYLIRWKLMPCLDAEGDSVGIILSGQDITESQHREEQLELWKSVVASADDAIIITEAEPLDLAAPIILYVNQAFTSNTGYSPDEVIGKTPRLLQGPKTDSATLDKLHTALEQKKNIQAELINYRKNGAECWVNLSIIPLTNEQNQVTHLVWVQRDINEQKYQTAALLETREAALEASQSKSQFLAQMSHEIRTPMNGVLGMVELLQRTNLTPQQQDYARTISRSAKHLLSVINDILDLSKLEAGETHLEHSSFDLDSCLESVVDFLVIKAEEKELELAILVDSNLPRQLEGDAIRLRQILLNLVSNAIKFTDEGSVVIQATLQSSHQQKISIRFTVKDTGIGISPELQTKLFKPFSQVSSSTRKYGGTGLGLSICQQFVKLMGGEIGVESTFDEGSNFWFTAEFDQSETATTIVPPAFSNLKLLVVDSSALVRQSILTIAQAWGIEVDQVDKASAALFAWQSSVSQGKPYNVVIVEECLLNTDSVELLRVMYHNSSLVRTKVILMSTMKQRQRAEQLMRLGDFGYLVKPVMPSRLFNSLVWALGESVEQSLPVENYSLTATSSQDNLEKPEPSLRILLAEDDLVNQQVILGQLNLLGYQADCVDNGQAVIDQLARQDYHIVLMDCQMPVIDGYEVTKLIRCNQRLNRGLIILALTASALSTDRDKCLEAGMDDYISKPVELEALGAVLRRWAKRSQKQTLVASSAVGLSTNNQFASQESNNLPQSEISTASDCPVDLERLKRIFKGKTAAQHKLLTMFVEQAKSKIEAIRQALGNADLATLEQQAHRLKGSSANAGVRQMPELAERLEKLAQRETLEGTSELIEELQSCLNQVQVFLAQGEPP